MWPDLGQFSRTAPRGHGVQGVLQPSDVAVTWDSEVVSRGLFFEYYYDLLCVYV